MTKTHYEVRYTILVDRPELRDSSFAPVTPGTRTHCVERHDSQAAAVRSFEAMRDGRWDFSSEIVSKVRVERVTTVSDGYDYLGEKRRTVKVRTVRKAIERERVETTREWQRQVLRVIAARKPTALFFNFYAAA